MNKKYLVALSVLLGPVLFLLGYSGCNRLSVSTGMPDGDTFVVVASDLHLSATDDKAARLGAAIRSANQLSAEAFIISGDAVARATDPDRNYIAELMDIGAEFTGDTFAIALGNHDYRKDTNSSSGDPLPPGRQQEIEAMWLAIADTPPYQSFNVNGYTFILLNTYRGHNDARFLDDEQMDWFENTLNNNDRVIIVMHHPVLSDRFRLLFGVPEIVTPSSEPTFFELVKRNQPKINAIFMGHGHFWMSDYLNRSIPVYMTTSLGEADNYGVHVVGLGKEGIEVRRLFASDLEVANKAE